jgi:hypothetical protein
MAWKAIAVAGHRVVILCEMESATFSATLKVSTKRRLSRLNLAWYLP